MNPVMRKTATGFAVLSVVTQTVQAGYIKVDFPIAAVTGLTTGTTNADMGYAAIFDPTTDEVRYPFPPTDKPTAAAAPSTSTKST